MGTGLKGGIACAIAVIEPRGDFLKVAALPSFLALGAALRDDAAFRDLDVFNGFVVLLGAASPLASALSVSGTLLAFFDGGDGARSSEEGEAPRFVRPLGSDSGSSVAEFSLAEDVVRADFRGGMPMELCSAGDIRCHR